MKNVEVTVRVERGMVFRLNEKKALVCAGCGATIEMKVVKGMRPNERGLEIMGFGRVNEAAYIKGVNAGDIRLICASENLCKKHNVGEVLPNSFVANGAGCTVGASCGCFNTVMVPVARCKKSPRVDRVMKKKAGALGVDILRINFLEKVPEPEATDEDIKANPRIVRTKPPHPMSCPDGSGGGATGGKIWRTTFRTIGHSTGPHTFKEIPEHLCPSW